MIPVEVRQTVLRLRLPVKGLPMFRPAVGDMVCWNSDLGGVQTASAFYPPRSADESFVGVCVERTEDSALVDVGGRWKARWVGAPLKVGSKISFAIDQGMNSPNTLAWTDSEGIGKVTALVDENFVEVELYPKKWDFE